MSGSAGNPRTVAVTGASAGVGRATAIEFGRRGHRVALLARGRDGLDGGAADVEEAGGTALAIQVDVSDPEAVDAAAGRIESELGPLDVWVNDAMATVFAPFEEIEPDEYRRSTEVTYLGAVWGTRAALRRMRPRGRGKVIQVGSALAFRGIPLQAPYCGAKHAIKGFTESVRCELMHDGSGIGLTMVQLPGLNTPQFDLGRAKLDRSPQPVPPIFQPEVAARSIAWAADHDRREIWVGASTYKTIWGNRLAPWLVDRVLARDGYEDQQTSRPVGGDRPGNLFEPVPGDHGARGGFDEISRSRSLAAWLIRHRKGAQGVVAATVTGAGASTAILLLRR